MMCHEMTMGMKWEQPRNYMRMSCKYCGKIMECHGYITRTWEHHEKVKTKHENGFYNTQSSSLKDYITQSFTLEDCET